jgi:hypothetical protein
MVADGSYKTAMESTEAMEEFTLSLGYIMDQAANMDW